MTAERPISGLLFALFLVAGSVTACATSAETTRSASGSMEPGFVTDVPQAVIQEPTSPPAPTAPTATVEPTTEQPAPTATVEPTAEQAEQPAAPAAATATAVVAVSQNRLPFVPTDLRSDDLGTRNTEFSGVTINESVNRLLVVEDGDRIFEFALDAAGSVVSPPLREIRIDAGGGDTEGIAWMFDEVYAIIGENFGLIIVVDLAGGVTKVTPELIQHSIKTGISEDDGSGAEGVAFDRSSLNNAGRSAPPSGWVFWSVKEKPATLVRLADGGSDVRSGRLPSSIADVADVFAAPNGRMFVVSHESSSVFELAVSADLASIEIIGVQSLVFGEAEFVQAEGLTFASDLSRMYVVSEEPKPGQFSYGMFTPVGS